MNPCLTKQLFVYLCASISVAACLQIISSDTNASEYLRTVAISGTAAPGTNANYGSFNILSTPAINNSGHVFFRAELSSIDTNEFQGRAFFSEGSGNGLMPIARTGDSAPGLGVGQKLSNLHYHSGINDLGQVAFRATVAGTGIRDIDFTIYMSVNNNLELVARGGTPIPGDEKGVNFSSLATPSNINSQGQVAFIANLQGTVDESNDKGIFSEGGGNGVSLIAREGDQAPGTELGVKFRFQDQGLSPLQFNDLGQTVFRTFLAGPGVDETNDKALFSEAGGNGLALIARAGDPAPGTEKGVSFLDGFGGADFNNLGQTEFLVFLAGSGVDETNDRAIYIENNGNGLDLVVREGEVAPGIGNAKLNGDFFSAALNDNGHMLLHSELVGEGVDESNNKALFKGAVNSEFELVVRSGDNAPGTTNDTKFFSFKYKPLMNNRNRIAFHADLAGENVNETNDTGIFAEDGNGQLQLIAREGDLLDVSNDPLSFDFRTIEVLDLARPFLGRGFNDLGQVVFRAEFTDGSSGIFVSNVAAVPEPTTLILAALVCLLFVTSKDYEAYHTPRNR